MLFPSLLLLISWLSTIAADKSYVAAVAEHKTFSGASGDSAEYKLKVNLDLYENLTALAKANGANILVFPEFGLNPDQENKREDLYPYAEKIGEVENNNILKAATPCTDASFSDRPILQRMSCSARNNKLIVLVNIVDWVDCNQEEDSNCPNDNHFQYNTNVIFDENGRLILKYHKSHEFPTLLKAYDVVEKPSQAVFHASFGVNFGVFTCFDIMFPDPPKALVKAGISHFLYPVSQGQIGEDTIISGWSRNNKAVVLSANLGAGSPRGDCSGILSYGEPLPATKVFLPESEENVLIASVLQV